MTFEENFPGLNEQLDRKPQVSLGWDQKGLIEETCIDKQKVKEALDSVLAETSGWKKELYERLGL